MLEAISPVLSLITAAANAMHWFADLRKQAKGEARIVAVVKVIKGLGV